MRVNTEDDYQFSQVEFCTLKIGEKKLSFHIGGMRFSKASIVDV